MAPRWPAVVELAERCVRAPSSLQWLPAPRTPRASGCPGSNAAVPDYIGCATFDLVKRIGECNEDVYIQAFLAQGRIEAFDMRVLNRLARFDVLQPYAMLLGPLVEHQAAQFGTVVHREGNMAGD
jgi:hypothetical protein